MKHYLPYAADSTQSPKSNDFLVWFGFLPMSRCNIDVQWLVNHAKNPEGSCTQATFG